MNKKNLNTLLNALLNALILLIVLLVLCILGLSYEGFGATSPGTMVQLSSSHVPTQEDLDYYKNVYPKVVRREIRNLTGGDPGNILLYPF
jgi:hypothetical protein